MSTDDKEPPDNATSNEQKAPRLSREEYRDLDNLLIDGEREAARSFDKAMITLAAGALALSLGLFTREGFTATVNWRLYVAWIGLVSSLLSVLVSFLFSQWAMRRQRDIIGDQYQHGFEKETEGNWYADAVDILNLSSIITFVIGVAFLVMFIGGQLN